MPRLEDPPPRLLFRANPRRSSVHAAELDFVEVAIGHALEKVRAEFKLPFQPLRPRRHRRSVIESVEVMASFLANEPAYAANALTKRVRASERYRNRLRLSASSAVRSRVRGTVPGPRAASVEPALASGAESVQ